MVIPTNNSRDLNELTRSLGFILINTSMRIKDELRKGFAEEGFDITPDQFAVLIRLWNEDGLSQKELCEKTLKTKSNMTRILDSMEKKGFVSRRMNNEDRRSYNIYLTQKSNSIQDKLVLAAVNMNHQIFKNITDEEQKNLVRVLDNISYNME